MHINQLSNAHSLASTLAQLTWHRDRWATVNLLELDTAKSLAHYDNLPTIIIDAEMHSMIVQAVVGEYDRRIVSAKAELEKLGVTTE